MTDHARALEIALELNRRGSMYAINGMTISDFAQAYLDLTTQLDALTAVADGMAEALQFISEGHGMLSQPRSLNEPQATWLERRIRAIESTAYKAATAYRKLKESK